MARKLSRRQRAEKTKEALFEKGCELLRSVDDPDGFVIEDITNPCGVSKATFYQYFKSKEDFYFRVKMTYADDVRELLVDSLQTGGTVRDRIMSFVCEWVRSIKETDLQMGQDWHALVADEQLRAEANRRGMDIYSYVSLLAELIESAVETGEFVPDTPCELVAKQVMAVLYGIHSVSVMTDKDIDFEGCPLDAAYVVDHGILQRWLADAEAGE